MKRFTLAACVLLLAALAAPAATFVLNADGTVTEQAGPPKAPKSIASLDLPLIDFDLSALNSLAVTAVQPSAPYVSPLGYHRHVTNDGKVVEHGDENNNRGGWTTYAHQGMQQSSPYVWPKYNGPVAPSWSQRITGRVCPT